MDINCWQGPQYWIFSTSGITEVIFFFLQLNIHYMESADRHNTVSVRSSLPTSDSTHLLHRIASKWFFLRCDKSNSELLKWNYTKIIPVLSEESEENSHVEGSHWGGMRSLLKNLIITSRWNRSPECVWVASTYCSSDAVSWQNRVSFMTTGSVTHLPETS